MQFPMPVPDEVMGQGRATEALKLKLAALNGGEMPDSFQNRLMLILFACSMCAVEIVQEGKRLAEDHASGMPDELLAGASYRMITEILASAGVMILEDHESQIAASVGASTTCSNN